MELKEFLFQKFLEWQKESGQRRSVKDWAIYLDVPQTSLSTWMNGPYLPKGAGLSKLAAKLGPEIYDVLGMTRPGPLDPGLQEIIDNWPNLSEEQREGILSTLRGTDKVSALRKGLKPAER